jgi:hypothetical protein
MKREVAWPLKLKHFLKPAGMVSDSQPQVFEEETGFSGREGAG